MTIKVCCDNGANIHSKRTEEVDVTDFGMTEEAWKVLDDEAKHKLVWEYINEGGWIEVWYEEK